MATTWSAVPTGTTARPPLPARRPGGAGVRGLAGVVSSANSLIGSTASDLVGYGVIALTNGNYVILSTSWQNGAVTGAGAVTWGSGTTGVSGVVSGDHDHPRRLHGL